MEKIIVITGAGGILCSSFAEFLAKNIKMNKLGGNSFDIYYRNEFFLSVNMKVAGKHNVYNALGAAAAAYSLGIDSSSIKEGLEEFGGTKRRFDKLGEFNGITVIDDYAHHPTEIKATLETAKSLGYKNVWCIMDVRGTFLITKYDVVKCRFMS